METNKDKEQSVDPEDNLHINTESEKEDFLGTNHGNLMPQKETDTAIRRKPAEDEDRTMNDGEIPSIH